jgi:hypothetical protein
MKVEIMDAGPKSGKVVEIAWVEEINKVAIFLKIMFVQGGSSAPYHFSPDLILYVNLEAKGNNKVF